MRRGGESPAVDLPPLLRQEGCEGSPAGSAPASGRAVSSFSLGADFSLGGRGLGLQGKRWVALVLGIKILPRETSTAR